MLALPGAVNSLSQDHFWKAAALFMWSPNVIHTCFMSPISVLHVLPLVHLWHPSHWNQISFDNISTNLLICCHSELIFSWRKENIGKGLCRGIDTYSVCSMQTYTVENVRCISYESLFHNNLKKNINDPHMAKVDLKRNVTLFSWIV